MYSDSVLGTIVFGDGIAQFSATDQRWVVRAKTPLVNKLVRDARGGYWVGTREGVMRMTVDGTQWRLASTRLDGSVSSLAIDPSGYLIAAVDGRGVFRARLP